MPKFEVFSADCPLCRGTLNVLHAAVRERGCGCEVVERRCTGDECCEPARRYGIRAVPTIVRDGQIVHTGKLTQQEAEALLPSA